MNKNISVEIKYLSDRIDHDVDNAFEFSMSRFGLKHTSSDFNKEQNHRILGFEKGRSMSQLPTNTFVDLSLVSTEVSVSTTET